MAGLNYISLALGLILGTYVTSFSNAYIYRRLQKQSDDVVLPEHRVPMMFVGSVLPPVGLLWYGWSAQARLHWVMPNIGALLFTAGAVTNFACIRLYLADAYTTFAASALASALVLRNLTAFGFPLFAPHMYGSLGYGWGNTLLALVAVVIGGPVPFVLWRYGAKIRARSGFVHGI
ncbi:MAG: hypothetical protein M1837_005284 [Sclerophora amabilis]|nr:MAG: hypothetical protein M1837_005284 [Sclerophora amabilis]